MKFTTEDQIEAYNLQLLDTLGYRYTHGTAIAPDNVTAEDTRFRAKDSGSSYLSPQKRQSYSEVLLKDRLTAAIARINRVYFEKQGGLIVDYLGIAHELKAALNFYSQSGGKGDLTLD